MAGTAARLLTSETAPRYFTSPWSSAALTMANAVTSSHHRARSVSTMTRGTSRGALRAASAAVAVAVELASTTRLATVASRLAALDGMRGDLRGDDGTSGGTVRPRTCSCQI